MFLESLHRLSLQYFIDNQMPNGLVLDRQRNHGHIRAYGLCSTATTGMGFIALALAGSPPYHLISRISAVERIKCGLQTALERLPHEEGIMPHFVDSVSQAVHGYDSLSTIDSAWLLAGAFTAAILLEDGELEALANNLYARVNWDYWTAPEEPNGRELLRHGKGPNGQFLGCSWDRLNGETIFMYVLGAGAAPGRSLSAQAWKRLQPFVGSVAGSAFCSADLGLFVFQYGLDLLDLRRWKMPGDVDLWQEAAVATEANRRICQNYASQFPTYLRHWGLSAGDGPGASGSVDCYRCYAPSGPIDGTAHLTATLASIVHDPEAVLENLHQADGKARPIARGRYGFSNVNLSPSWVSEDVVGIDLGSVVLSLDNFLIADRVRTAFHRVPCVRQGLECIGFRKIESIHEDPISMGCPTRQAS
ncbi:MAG: glucoamylase family protein [Gemmataceae bacterium]